MDDDNQISITVTIPFQSVEIDGDRITVYGLPTVEPRNDFPSDDALNIQQIAGPAQRRGARNDFPSDDVPHLQATAWHTGVHGYNEAELDDAIDRETIRYYEKVEEYVHQLNQEDIMTLNGLLSLEDLIIFHDSHKHLLNYKKPNWKKDGF